MTGKTDLQKKSVIDEEIAANACFTVLSNEDNFTALVKQNRSLAEKVRDFFADFVEKIKNALTRLAKNNAEYRALQNDTEAKEKILAMFNKALESSNTNVSNNSEIRLSKKITDSLDSFTNEVLDMDDDQAQKYKSDDTYVSIMTNTPFVILENVKDAEDLEVIMRFDAFYLETRKSGVLDGNYHNLGMEMSELPKFLNNPDAIIRNQNGRLNLITAIGANKNRLISIELNTVKDINSMYKKYNLVVSVFNSGKNYINNVIKKASALEYEKEDLPQVNHQLHKSLAIINDKSSNNTVPQKDTVVNNHDIQNEPKYSLKETADYSYKSLVSKPDMSVTVINDQKDYTPGKSTRENVVDEAQRSALSVGRKDSSGNVYVYVNDTDTEVMLSKRGLRHSLDRRLSIIAPVTENIGPIIKNSIRINELSPELDTIEKSYVLIGIAKNQNNEPYIVSFVVNRASNEVTSVDVLYAVNTKTEPAGSLSPELSSQNDVSLTGSNISISDLLDYVNRYYPDILPEDVLRHYGYTVRPDGVIGESALYSLKEEDNTSVFEDNEELAESAEDVQNMLRLVSTENNELRKAFDIRTVRQAYVNKHLIKPNSIKIHFQKFSIISNRLCHKIFLQTQSNCKRGV